MSAQGTVGIADRINIDKNTTEKRSVGNPHAWVDKTTGNVRSDIHHQFSILPGDEWGANCKPLHIRGFTLIELLVSLAVLAILVSLLLPALSKAKETSKRIICAKNLGQTYLGFRMYSDDFNGWYPGWNESSATGGYWAKKLTALDYIKGGIVEPRPYAYKISLIFKCPSDNVVWEGISSNYWNLANGPTSYGANGTGYFRPDLYWQWAYGKYVSAKQMDSMGIKVMLADAYRKNPSFNGLGLVYGPSFDPEARNASFRHNAQANVLFTDGHVVNGRYEDVYADESNTKFTWRYPGN